MVNPIVEFRIIVQLILPIDFNKLGRKLDHPPGSHHFHHLLFIALDHLLI
jgi:hypothetical protein